MNKSKERSINNIKMKYEGVFKMHSEDDDLNLPISYQNLFYDRFDDFQIIDCKNWRLKERVNIEIFKPFLRFLILSIIYR
jgi:hypothetical protein